MRSLRRLSKKLKIKTFLPIGVLVVSLIVLAFSGYNLNYSEKIFPGISAAGVSFSGLTHEEAARLLSEKIPIPEVIKLVNQSQNFNLETKEIGLSFDFPLTAQNAFNVTRTGNFFPDMAKRLDLLVHPLNLKLVFRVDDEKLSKFVSVIAGQDTIEAKSPSINIVKGIVVVNKGIPGSEVDREVLKSRILSQLSEGLNGDVSIPVSLIDNSLTDDEALSVKSRAEKYLGKTVQIKFEFDSFVVKDSDLINLLGFRGGFNDETIGKFVDLYSQKIDRDAQNPKFTFDSGRVTEFQPALDGVRTDKEVFKQQVVTQLSRLEESADKTVSFEIPVLRTPPEVSTDKVNDLGIRELIGRGTSTFFHSIPTRVHNVVLATSRINGTLVKPGETFSFNTILGDVSSFTGYQQAYIISGGKTILGDGGGVCQVSTTLFRAILNGGLPVDERAAHAYRVGYYEQNSPPGIDATVYGPSPDLKFTNDTPGYILIEAKADPKHYSLVFELYGTSDGRTATVSKPVISNISPAPPDIYQDDPTLKAGVIKQIDFRAAGAKVVFNYTVNRGGEQIYKKTFVSNYRPWQAIYLRGTGPK